MAKVKVGSVSSAINQVLEQYSDKVGDMLDEVIKEVANEAKKQLAATSPKRTGRYAKGWRVENKGTRLGPSQVVYNTQPGLPHLLEFGHAKRGGGRVSAQPHIAPVNDNIPELVEERLERKL